MQLQPVPSPSSSLVRAPLVGWLLDAPIVADLLGRGAKIRVKQGHRNYTERSGGESVLVEQAIARVLLLKPTGFGFTRRLAEVCIRSEDHPEFDHPMESIALTIYGERHLLRRARLYTGEVATREQTCALLARFLAGSGSAKLKE